MTKTDERREQALSALELANQRRFAAAEAKRALALGERSLGDVLRDPNASSAKVAQVLAAQPHWGPVRAAELMDQMQIGSLRRVGDLTDRQIDLLIRGAQLPKGERWQLIVRGTGVAV